MDDLRTFFQSATLPATMTPRPHMHIVDVKKFVETNLARLDSDSARLRRLAEGNLKALKNSLTNT